MLSRGCTVEIIDEGCVYCRPKTLFIVCVIGVRFCGLGIGVIPCLAVVLCEPHERWLCWVFMDGNTLSDCRECRRGSEKYLLHFSLDYNHAERRTI